MLQAYWIAIFASEMIVLYFAVSLPNILQGDTPGDNDNGAGRGKALRHGETNPAVSAGYKRDPCLQIESCHGRVPRVRHQNSKCLRIYCLFFCAASSIVSNPILGGLHHQYVRI